MTTSTKTMPAKCFRIGAVLVAALMVFPELADARGGRGGGGIARGGPASSGGFTGRSEGSSALISSSSGESSGGISIAHGRSSGTAGQPRDIRSGRDVRPAGGAGSSVGAGQPRGAASPGDESNVVTRAATAPRAAAVKDATPEEMARYRQQFNRDNKIPDVNEKDGAADHLDWDRPRPVDPDYSVPVRAPGERVIPPGTIATGAVLGTAIAREDALEDYAGGAGSDYYTELPCTLQGNAEVDDSKYYKCDKGWFKRVYRGDDVVYVQVDAPPGM